MIKKKKGEPEKKRGRKLGTVACPYCRKPVKRLDKHLRTRHQKAAAEALKIAEKHLPSGRKRGRPMKTVIPATLEEEKEDKKEAESIPTEEEAIRNWFYAKNGSTTIQYTVGKIIGEGGYGKVCLGAKLNGDHIAVKVFNGTIEFDEEKKNIDVIGMAAAGCLKYLFFNRGDFHIGMEYMPNTAATALRSSKEGVPYDITRRIMRGLLQGLASIHEKGLVHRDIRPANVFYDSKQAKLGDFGVSRELSPKGTTKRAVYPEDYRAPEILAKHNYRASADVWAAGCLFLELLTGEAAFETIGGLPQVYMIMKNWKIPDSAEINEICKTPEDRKVWHDTAATVFALPDKRAPDHYLGKCPEAKKPDVLQLASGLLRWRQAERLPAEAALHLPYFKD